MKKTSNLSKTLLIMLPTGTSIRNILRTNIFKVLSQNPKLHIVISTPIFTKEFIKEFQKDNVSIEPQIKCKINWLRAIIQTFRRDWWAHLHPDITYFFKRKNKYLVFNVRVQLIKFLVFLFFRNNHAAFFKFLLKLDRSLVFNRQAKKLLEKHRPDLVFYLMYNKFSCVETLAEKMDIKTVAFINSWDNPTTIGPFANDPTQYIVWNTILQHELIHYHQVPQEKIIVAGIPQFDLYLDKGKFLSKAAFFAKHHLDINRKLITYTTGTVHIYPNEHKIVRILYDLVINNAFSQPCQLLLRPHPQDDFSAYQEFIDKPLINIQYPGRQSKVKDKWDPTLEDMYGLAELMQHSDVVINVASTITIDAIAFDTPVINIAFDVEMPRPYAKSCVRYYDYTHYKNIVNTQGVKIAYNSLELQTYIEQYLQNPQMDQKNRECIRQQQIGELDGQASQRIANTLLTLINAQ